MPGLPQINLPSVAQPQAKKEPTLLRADVAEQLATQKKKSLAVPIISVVVLILATGATLFVYKDAIIERFFPALQKEAVETNTDKARKLVALGTSFYESNQMPNALAAFEQALAVDPTYAKAHRSLGIAYAKMNQPDKAVTHYRTYLVLAPTADDAEAVRKIVADYDLKAKEQAAADKAKAEEERKAAAEEKKKKKR
jgi:tetratricopeptide (TPR) repeat protein